ncbi:hypothetical protein COX97_02385 [Candidatus Pacearchaeota archaeon CG_4_10_14_0_2_um_filter_05_32_18]|nr:MAG: hypothetical protein AUJ62_00280 [Candidatus Pacearchaeota archaeon CG1_02_32_21]PIZ82891.1 MAG: hypothetical protein COX97_02385 [Candidatus Pacearchaeota archaeon CG_4_10_14_0_2_um_filter_05_32_18]
MIRDIDKQVEKKNKEILKLSQEKAKLVARLASQKAKSSISGFRKGLRTSVSTAIVAAFSFLIALVWKDLITLYVDRISLSSPIQGQLFTTVLITIICVAGILITTKILSVKEQ